MPCLHHPIEPITLIAVMLFPQSGEDQSRAVDYLEARWWAGAFEMLVAKKPDLPVPPSIALRVVKGIRSEQKILAKIERSFNAGIASGLILSATMGHAAIKAKKKPPGLRPSLSLAFKVHSVVRAEARERGFTEQTLREVIWPKYRSVAHFWATAAGWRRAEVFFSASNLLGFLTVAELVRARAEAYTPSHSRSPVLDPAITWRVAGLPVMKAPLSKYRLFGRPLSTLGIS